jgi:hypothetical protein
MEPNDPQRQRSTAVDKPPVTETAAPLPELEKVPVNHKIVVLGATGKVGRLVVQHLLESSPDGSVIVAVVRDYDKACCVLYDDLIVLKQMNSKGPRLQIVTANLVSRSDLPAKYNFVDDKQEEIDEEWRKRAEAAAQFYGNEVNDYDDGRLAEDDNTLALQQALEGCTAVVSCVGAIRTTKPWLDWWLTRLLSKDVRGWCMDANHPFYTQYSTTRKILQMVEREQEKRNLLFQAQDESDAQVENADLIRRRRDKNAPPRRIRFIRLSDLAVAQKPWALVPVLTNAIRSMVFRYHEMADDLLRKSSIVDTVIVRAGDLVDEERDESEVGVQVLVDEYQIRNVTKLTPSVWSSVDYTDASPEETSRHWSPARVGRDDVAALLSAAVLAPWLSAENQTTASVHYNLAVRWSGDARAMAPYPAQGTKTNGCRTAAKSLQKAIRKFRRQALESATHEPISSRLKPYGLCVAIPLYLAFAVILRNLIKGLLLAVSSGSNIYGDVWPMAVLPNLRPIWQVVMQNVFRKSPAVQYISF